MKGERDQETITVNEYKEFIKTLAERVAKEEMMSNKLLWEVKQ